MRVSLIIALCALAGVAGAAITQTQGSVGQTSADWSPDAITIPRLLSYQGQLTDTLGVPVPDGEYPVVFRLYSKPSGGSSFWNETQAVTTKDGLFSVLLGSVTPIAAVPDAGAAYLGMAVAGGVELAPRLRLGSAAYAFKAETAGHALAAGNADSAWSRARPDSVLFTTRLLGIARGGAENELWGERRFTHANLGVACTTGTARWDWPFCTVSGGYANGAADEGATVAGGAGNRATASHATVSGGGANAATYSHATVGGGRHNTASAANATVAGGKFVVASGYCSAVGGGLDNVASGSKSTVSGGSGNLAAGDDAAVPGGSNNAARGQRSLAAGSFGRANHDGSFIWADISEANDSVYTTGANQWRVRAQGGTWFFSDAGSTTGTYLAAGSNSWASACDSANKTDFREVDRRELLEKLAAMPMHDYRMKTQHDGTRHIGPVAQDFHAAFGFGENDVSINNMDAIGVSLAAIQALYERLTAQESEIRALRAELARR
ncbi:MAG: tail fiber domain-containing protein [bacterium]